MEAFGFNWEVGEPWGIAHPKHSCYSDPSQVTNVNGHLYFGIEFKPAIINDKKYQWAIGKVHSEQLIKYGTIDATFQLPLGRHLWPAIWLYDVENWPPEIDILEGWSGYGYGPLKGRNDYLRLPWCQYIHPGLVHPNGLGGAYGTCGNKGVWRWQINTQGRNQCRLVWKPEKIEVSYNGYVIMCETRPEVLKAFNDSHGMTIVLNNYVTNDFNMDDYWDITRTYFRILDLKYRPL